MDKRILSVLLLLVGLASLVAAQDMGAMGVVSPATSKFGNMAGLPTCMTLSVLHGDPSNGPSVILLKLARQVLTIHPRINKETY